MSRSLNVLIVEDEVLVAAELAWIVEQAGHRVIAEAISSDEAWEAAASNKPDLALVDVHLHDGPTGVELARRIATECGAMVLFMTANQKRIPEDYAGAAGLISKPYSTHGIEDALAYVAHCMEHGCAQGAPPHSLSIAPRFAEQWRRSGSA
jgi:DNA-binding response OmpR family regulator